MGGSGGIVDLASTGGFGALHESGVSTFKEDTAANILLMGAPMGLKQTQKELGLGGEAPDAPTAGAANIATEEQIQAAAKRKREFELVRKSGFQGRASTIKTGSRGTSSGVQTTFKQLSGR